jgi:lipase
VRLHVHEWGAADAQPLFCLHGVTSWGGRYRKLAEERLGAFHVLAPDLRGHGRSGWEPPWNLGTNVADLIDTLDAFHVDRTDVVGHSWGGRLALELAARRPERVARLVLLDPVVWVPPRIALERAEEARPDRSFASVDEAIADRLGNNPFTDPALVAEDVPGQLELGADGLWRGRYTRSAVVAAYGEMAKRPALDKVTAPTLLIRGRDSEVVPDPAVEIVLAAMPGCEIVTVPGGHIVMWDAFEETAAAIQSFLEDSGA